MAYHSTTLGERPPAASDVDQTSTFGLSPLTRTPTTPTSRWRGIPTAATTLRTKLLRMDGETEQNICRRCSTCKLPICLPRAHGHQHLPRWLEHCIRAYYNAFACRGLHGCLGPPRARRERRRASKRQLAAAPIDAITAAISCHYNAIVATATGTREEGRNRHRQRDGFCRYLLPCAQAARPALPHRIVGAWHAVETPPVCARACPWREEITWRRRSQLNAAGLQRSRK